ncbi:phenylalanine--tRNA ligase subunit beta [Candidatus Micrarchaeota archaeon]|nr:phenylalanine--tRNA ligase subunit beta [Candidatus Micrarchaeota archaeon]
MAVINVEKKKLEKMCGHSEKKIIDCLTNIGMPIEGGEAGIIEVEITPDRPDLFCIEGLSRAIRAYYDKENNEYSAKPSKYSIAVSPKTRKVRPAISAAVVKGLKITEEVLVDLMQMQEKLHTTVGRKRRKMAIGIHDLDKLEGEMEYFVSSGKERFVPLEMEGEMGVGEVLEKHEKGRAFAHLVGEDAVLIKDEKGVFSFPPIINGERTRVTTETRNVLIESTGTCDETVKKAVNIIATALSDKGGEVYEVKVGDEKHPDFSYGKVKMELSEANRVLGLNLSEKEASKALLKMGIKVKGGYALVPPYRADVISFTDILEDIAIGYGYENLEPTFPEVCTTGSGLDSKEPIHDALVGMGFLEIKTYILTNMEKLEATCRNTDVLMIENSASEEFTCLRTSLIPGLLGCFANNKMKGLPQLFYELGRVYQKKEESRLCFGVMMDGASITDVQPYLQTLLRELGKEFELKAESDPCFIGGRCAKVIIGGKDCGVIGAIHPATLEKFNTGHAIALCELDVEALIK